MGLVSGLAVYVVVWWVVLFAVLPWGVQRDEQPSPGADRGAPRRPRILVKFAVTTVAAAVIWGIIEAVILSGLVSFRAMAGGS